VKWLSQELGSSLRRRKPLSKAQLGVQPLRSDLREAQSGLADRMGIGTQPLKRVFLKPVWHG